MPNEPFLGSLAAAVSSIDHVQYLFRNGSSPGTTIEPERDDCRAAKWRSTLGRWFGLWEVAPGRESRCLMRSRSVLGSAAYPLLVTPDFPISPDTPAPMLTQSLKIW